jgi:hypothetical protein
VHQRSNDALASVRAPGAFECSMSARRQLHELTPDNVPHGTKYSLFDLRKKLFRVNRISFERECHANQVCTVHIDWNVAGNEDQEWRRKFWKDV